MMIFPSQCTVELGYNELHGTVDICSLQPGFATTGKTKLTCNTKNDIIYASIELNNFCVVY
jgi:hypothetical protein